MVELNKLKSLLVLLLINFSFVCMPANAATKYKIKSSDSLSGIAGKFYKKSDLTRHQIFIGILADNPNAFRFGNINYLKKGQTLVLPDAKSLLAMEPKDATKLVAEHNNNANKGLKVKLNPPFEGYSPKNSEVKRNATDLNELAKKQQAASDKLKMLDSESEQLRIRLEQLEADKKAMDEELEILENLITE